ncbi:MAG: isoprenoid biosynthesis protein ElbB [Acidobacteria bacterium]|nr:MAG: isoprenoid biosynthesis protein ElbB [Acidobacteriota bacterium]
MKVGYLLAGSGFLDGAEIQEAVSGLIALAQEGVQIVPIAPDMKQHHVIDHQSGQEVNETRNVLVEAARIVRGNVTPLSDISVEDLDALVIAGGFGVAKNLCDLAFKGPDCVVLDDCAALVNACHAAKKPIGAMCIAPAMVAKILGAHTKVKLTIGSDPGTIEAIEAMGCEHVICNVNSFVTDEINKVVSTPAYMLGPGPADVFKGISGMCKEVVRLAN